LFSLINGEILAIREAIVLAEIPNKAGSRAESQFEGSCRYGYSQYLREIQLNGFPENRNVAHKRLA
jgi:hypothetical protein